MRDSVAPEDFLAIYNDGSTEYDNGWLKQFGQPGTFTPIDYVPTAMGIQAQRRMHLNNFMQTACTHLYFSDHDVLMDPTWRENALRLQAAHGHAPLCLYNTDAHVRLTGNTIEDDPTSEV